MTRGIARPTGKGGARSAGRQVPGSLWASLLLTAVVVAVYYNSLQNEFLFDDLQVIVEQQQAGGAGQFAPLVGLLKGDPAHRPIRSASYAFDYALSGLEPWGYHLTNIAYHALSAIVVFLIAQSLFNQTIPALFTALLFAVHPIQTEAVTYLSGRRDVLSGLLVLLGVYLFMQYRRTARIGYLAPALAVYPLAFFSKEGGIVLPVLCFGYDVVSRIRAQASGDGSSRSRLREVWMAARAALVEGWRVYLPFITLAIGFASYTLLYARESRQTAYYGGSFWMTMLTEARVIVHYLRLLVFPLTLNADYSYNAFPVTVSWIDPSALLAVLMLIALGCAALYALPARPFATLGVVWFFAALLPVAQIVPHHELMAEHFLYIPSVGFCLAIAALLDPLLGHPRAVPVLYAGGVTALLLLSVRTVWRNADWRDDLTLWSKTVQTAPQAARARNNLGTAYLRRGERQRAEEQLEAAARIKPDLAVAHGNLGKVALDQGDLERAERALQTSLRLQEDVIPRLWLGVVFVRQGRLTEAEQQFRAVLARPPYDAYAYNDLGVLFAKSGRMAEAEAAFRAALARMPDLAEPEQNLARLRRLREGGGPPATPARGAGS